MTAKKANTYTLPESLGAAAAPALHEALRGLRGAALTLEATQVRRLSAQTMQVLLSAARTWRADGKVLSLESPSEALTDALRLLGLGLSDITAEKPAP